MWILQKSDTARDLMDGSPLNVVQATSREEYSIEQKSTCN